MRFEQWARNPACEANTVAAVRNARMARVAEALGLPVTFGQSPFAIARGNRFERALFDGGAGTLTRALADAGVLPEGPAGFVDLRLRKNGGAEVTTLDEAIARTDALIRDAARGRTGRRTAAPAVVAGATIRIPGGVFLPEATLILDELVIRHDLRPPAFVVGEVKAYPDRGGHTAPHDLALARAQAGVYVHALDLRTAGLGLSGRVAVSRRGFLVLTRPGSNRPSVRAGEDLHYQAERARRGFDLLERAAGALGRDLWAADGADVPDVLLQAVLSAGTAYNESCLSFCELAPRCFEAARRRGDPATLGEEVVRFLGPTDLNRAVQLLGGAPPRDEGERDLVRRVRVYEGMLNP
jgi:hypothetical protein